MANTYSSLIVQTVFAVKYRNALVQRDWKDDLFAIIGNLINETDCKTHIVNGVSDHVHCLFGFKPKLSLSEIMKSVKAKSSKWLNESNRLKCRFEWQDGFGPFSYSHRQTDSVFRYIKRQEEHHRKVTFFEEYEIEHDRIVTNWDDYRLRDSPETSSPKRVPRNEFGAGWYRLSRPAVRDKL